MNNGHIWLLKEISNDEFSFHYSPIDNEMFVLNKKNDTGVIYTYNELRDKLLQESNINLRRVLSEYWGGVRFGRENYLIGEELILNFDKLSVGGLCRGSIRNLCEHTTDLEVLFPLLNKELNHMDEYQLVEVEILIVFIFYKYASYKYKNGIELVESSNQFGEKFYSVYLINSRGKINLTHLVFRFLYISPDDYDDNENLDIDLNNVKAFIDYFNSDRYFYVDDSE